MDRYEEMRVFAAVADAGSFVAAATTLGLSKPAVSRYVSELEARLRVRLMHRTTRKLSLTPEGEVFLVRCREILSSIAASEAEVSTGSEIAYGLLKVSVPVSFGIEHLAPLWAKFLELHPGVSLEIQLADRVIDLVHDGFDLAVRIARLPDSTLIAHKLASTPLVLCASPKYLALQGAPEHPSELARHHVISYTLLPSGDHWQFEGADGVVTVKVRPRLWTNNGDTCVAAAVRGAGVILQPTFLVSKGLASGELVELLPGYRSHELGIYAVYPTRKFVPPKVRALVDFLARELDSSDWL
jgi:DNA-binding transcriptional LysR family regulator